MIAAVPTSSAGERGGTVQGGAGRGAAPRRLRSRRRLAPPRQFDSFDFVDFSFQVSSISVFLRKQTYVLGSA